MRAEGEEARGDLRYYCQCFADLAELTWAVEEPREEAGEELLFVSGPLLEEKGMNVVAHLQHRWPVYFQCKIG